MKHIYIFLTVLLFSVSARANTPDSLNYQIVVRDAGNNLIKETTVSFKICILKDSDTGSAVYEETHATVTNANGLATLVIGNGTVVSGNFSTIDWSSGIYFIRTDIDPQGGTNYTVTSIVQMLSVPYAMHAKTAATASGSGLKDIISNSNDGNNQQIKNLTAHTDTQDAVTKKEVDELKIEIFNLIAGGTVTDIDGNTYNTIKIGDQVWMAENMKVTHYPNGNPIPFITNDSEWSNLANDNTSDAYCYANNNTNGEANTYGALYSYAAAIADNWTNDNTNNQGICPDGWHLPSSGEWLNLINFLGGNSVAGGKLKEVGTEHWSSPNTGADNTSAFTALPGGYRDGATHSLNAQGYWWSATENTSTTAIAKFIYNNDAGVWTPGGAKSMGYSVRCVKD